MLHLQIWQFVLVAIAAYAIGLSKTGIAGVGIVAVVMFSMALPPKTAVGAVLPLLICADCFAVAFYRRNAVWSHLFRLFPWAMAGIAIGAFAMSRIDNHQAGRLIGILLLGLTALQVAQKQIERRKAADTATTIVGDTAGWLARGGAVTAMLGLLAGFATMVGNAAGPLMILYLLAARLPKTEFVGTGAWYFFCLNLFKVPFSLRLGMISHTTLGLDLSLVAFVIAGAITGKPLLPHIDQKLFENLAMFFTLLTALWLVLK